MKCKGDGMKKRPQCGLFFIGFRRFKGFRGFRGFRGLWYRPAGDEYKVSVTGFTLVSSVLHDGE